MLAICWYCANRHGLGPDWIVRGDTIPIYRCDLCWSETLPLRLLAGIDPLVEAMALERRKIKPPPSYPDGRTKR